MFNYVIRRLLLAIPTLIGMTFVVFFVMAKSPGGIGGSLLNELGQIESQQSRMLKEYYENRYGLNKPVLVQYGRWLNQVSPVGFQTRRDPTTGQMVRGSFGVKEPDLGDSLAKGRPVLDLYAEALPVTLMLNAVTLPLVYLMSIYLGIYAARHRGRLLDVGSSLGSLTLWSLPLPMVGVLLIGFFANRDNFYWFPPSGLSSIEAHTMAFLPRVTAGGFERGWLLDRMWHLAMPVLCLLYGSFAFVLKLMRASVLENLSADFVRTARAKGLEERRVLWGHAFRNSLLPLLTMLAGVLPGLLVGSVIVEQIFSLPGMGKLMLEAIFSRDRELVMAGTLISGVLGLLSILIADLLYAVADPRVSYD